MNPFFSLSDNECLYETSDLNEDIDLLLQPTKSYEFHEDSSMLHLFAQSPLNSDIDTNIHDNHNHHICTSNHDVLNTLSDDEEKKEEPQHAYDLNAKHSGHKRAKPDSPDYDLEPPHKRAKLSLHTLSANAYDAEEHETAFSAQEIGFVHGMCANFACKMRGRRRISMRMVKLSLDAEHNTNQRTRTLRDIHSVFVQCFDGPPPPKADENVNGRRVGGETMDFDDEHLVLLTHRATEKLVRDLQVAVEAVEDRTPDKLALRENLSHRRTMGKAFERLKLAVEQQSPVPHIIFERHFKDGEYFVGVDDDGANRCW